MLTRLLAILLSPVIGGITAPQVSDLAARQERPRSVESEVVQNIGDQPIGSGQVVADLGLPKRFVERVADRVIRSSYRSQYHRVSGEVQPPEEGVPVVPRNPKSIDRIPLRVRDLVEASEDEKAYRERIPLGRPFVRGFRLGRGHWPYADPMAHVVETRRKTAAAVARNLATIGLVATTASAIELLSPQYFVRAGTKQLNRLREVGVPVDLLEFFDRHGNGLALIRDIANRLVAGATAEELRSELRQVEFKFNSTQPGFRAMSEAGDEAATDLRVQLTRGDSWGGLEDGGSVEIVRQLLERLPLRVTAHVENRYLAVLRESMAALAPKRRELLTVLPTTYPVSQWAQDNGKAGSIDGRAATLIPRYTSRREDGSEFIEGEAYLLDSLAANGHPLVWSPLLFQGGDILVATRPELGQRWAFIGEAEVYRNVALGLTVQQTLDAFRIELGVDRCVEIPSISFHLDYDLSLRVVEGRLVAFTNDRGSAVEHILRSGFVGLERGGVINNELNAALCADMEAARTDQNKRKSFYQRLSQIVYGRAGASGGFPVDFVRLFSGDDLHRALGNFGRFLTAIDIYIADSFTEIEASQPGIQFAMIRSYQRQTQLTKELESLLRSHGIRVVPVPSLSDGDRSLTALNGLHLPGVLVRPVYGGAYRLLDAAARSVYADVLGKDVRIIDVHCAESQRRNGAIHCSVAPYSAPLMAN